MQDRFAHAGIPDRSFLDRARARSPPAQETLIPVLHNVTFEQVAEYSGILPDLAGFETARDSVQDIAAKIAAAILPTTT